MNKKFSNGINHSIKEINRHDHLSLIYEDQKELWNVIIPFLEAGLGRGDKCYLIYDQSLRQKFTSDLQEKNFDFDSYLESRQLEIINIDGSITQKEKFSEDHLSSYLDSLDKNATNQGYSSSRFVIDMSWVATQGLSISQLINYESVMGEFFLYHQACGICQFDRNRFEPEHILIVLKMHRLIIYKQEILSNPIYSAPSKFDLAKQAECDVNSMLDGLRDLKQRDNELLLTIKNLKNLVQINETISRTMDMAKIVSEVINNLFSHIDTAAVGVLTYDPDQKYLSYYAVRGFLEKYALDQIQVPVESIFKSWPEINEDLILINRGERGSELPSYIERFHRENFSIYIAHILNVDGKTMGILELYVKDPQFDNLFWRPYITDLGHQLANAIDNAQTYQQLKQKNFELTRSYDMTLERLAKAMDRRDDRISRNTQRVAEITEKLARQMGASDEELLHIRRGILLTSISKMSLPDKLINKEGPLDEDEWDVIHRHPQMVFDLLEDIKIIRPALEIPFCHHEYWNGSGYPRGLEGEEIPLSARQFAVVDVYDALLTARPYRPSWREADAVAYIRSLSGVQFDPKVVEAFLKMLNIQE